MTSNRFFRVGFVLLGMTVATVVVLGSQSHVVYGAGTMSCGAWMAEKKERVTSVVNTSWVLGFVSGASTATALNKTDRAGIETWIDQYCAKNPLEMLDSAAQELVLALRTK